MFVFWAGLKKKQDDRPDFFFFAEIFPTPPLKPLNRKNYNFRDLSSNLAGAASQAGDADSSRAPGLTSGLQRSENVHRGALLWVPQ